MSHVFDNVSNKTYSAKNDAYTSHSIFLIMIEKLREALQSPDVSEDFCFRVVERYPELLKDCFIQTYNVCVVALRQNPFLIKDVRDQTEELCLLAIKYNSGAIEHIRNLTDEFILKALRCNAEVIGYVEQTEERCLCAVRGSPHALKHIDNPTEEMLFLALKMQPEVIAHRLNWTLEMYEYLIRTKPSYIGFIPELSLELQELVMDIAPDCFKYIRNSHESIVQRAIECGTMTSLEYVKHKTREICEIALATDPTQIIHVPPEYQTDEMWFAAMEINPACLMAHPDIKNDFLYRIHKGCYTKRLIDGEPDRCKTSPPRHLVERAVVLNYNVLVILPKQPDDICMRAIKNNPAAINHIPDPSDEMWIEAIKRKPSLLKRMKNPTPEMIDYACSLQPELTVYKENVTDNELLDIAETHPNILEDIPSHRVSFWERLLEKDPSVLESACFDFRPDILELALKIYPRALSYRDQSIDIVIKAMEISPDPAITLECIDPVFRRFFDA